MPGRERSRAALVSLLGNYAASLLAIVKGIVFVPLYFKLLGSDVYGAWLASGNVVGLLGMLDAGISSAVYQRLGELWGAGDRQRFVRTTGAAALILVVLGSILILLAAGLAPAVPRLVHAPATSWDALSLAFVLQAVGAAGTMVVGNLLAVSSAWQETGLGATTRLAGQLAETVTIALGLWRGMGVLALGVGALTGASCSLFVGTLWTGLRWRRLSLGRIGVGVLDLRELGSAAVPLMIGRIVLQIDGNIEVTLVSILMNPSLAAVYAITDRILHMAVSFINPIAASAISGLSHLVGEKGRTEALRPARELIALWSLVVTAVLPALLAINRDFTVLWVGGSNYGGLGLNVALFVSEVLGGREFLFSVLLLSSGAIGASAWISTSESLIRMPLMYLALLLLGWIGMPAIQAVVSIAFLGVYAHLVGRQFELGRSERIRLLTSGFGPPLLSFSVGLAEAAFLPVAHGWPTLALKGVAIAAIHGSIALVLCGSGRSALGQRLTSLLRRSPSAVRSA